MSVDHLREFRAARDRIQAMRDASRDALRGGTSTRVGFDLDGICEDAADALYDRIAYAGSGWTMLANGASLPASTVAAAVCEALPDEFDGERRERLAQVITASATFRERLRLGSRRSRSGVDTEAHEGGSRRAADAHE